MPSLSSWYADGLRWIGSLFIAAADRLERPSIAPAPLEPQPDYRPAEEFLSDVRLRVQSRSF